MVTQFLSQTSGFEPFGGSISPRLLPRTSAAVFQSFSGSIGQSASTFPKEYSLWRKPSGLFVEKALWPLFHAADLGVEAVALERRRYFRCSA
jgi:hypothetical protein